MNQLKGGAILSYFTIFLNNTIGLVLTPFVINSIGDSEYGLYTLVGALIAQISIFNLGLNNTVVRYVSIYRAQKNKNAEEIFLGAIMTIYLAISIIICIVGFTVYNYLDLIFYESLSPDEIVSVKSMFLVLIFNVAITLPGGTFEAVASAYQRFVFPKLISIGRYLIRIALIFLILGNYPNAISLIWIDTILNLAVIIITMYFALKKLKVKFVFNIPKIDYVNDIFSYSIWIIIYAVAYQLQWFSGQSILGVTTDSLTVGVYGIGILLGGYYGAFAGALNTLLLPKATELAINSNDPEIYNVEIIKIGRINIFILLMILGGFYLFGKKFIVFWLGAKYSDSWFIAIVVMLTMTLPLVQAFGNSILEAKKKNRFKAVISAISLIISSIFGFVLSKYYGLYSVLYPLSCAVLFNSFCMSYYYKKIFDFDFLNFLRKVFLKQLLAFVLLIYVFKELLIYIRIESYISLIFGIILFVISYIFINFYFVLDKQTKLILFNFRWLK